MLLDTGILWLTVVDTLGDDITLLGLISESVSLVWARRLAGSVDGRQLSVLPGSDSENESHNIRLLLVPQLLEVLVSSH